MKNAPTLSAFMRAPAPHVSNWHMGSLLTYLADAEETGGAYSLFDTILKQGGEPPPHVHSREDELFFVIEGQFDVYVGEAFFHVNEGGCVFLPRFKPHAFIICSPRIHLLTLYTPGGIDQALRHKSIPAQTMDLPTETVAYSTEDLEETARRLADYGVRILTPDEIASQLPHYPQPHGPAR